MTEQQDIPKDTPIKVTYTHPKPSIWPYFAFLFLLVGCIFLPIAVFQSKIGLLWFILSLFLAIPLGLFALLGGIIKTWLDRRKIGAAITKKLTRNFIIADIFKNNKRMISRTLKINKDGITATDGEKDYLLDLEAIWYDEQNYPHIFYVENVPNGLSFGFEDEMRQGIEKMIGQKPFLKGGKVVDISYSSENLQKLKKDKFLEELHRPMMGDKERMMYLVLIGLCVLAIVLVVIFMKGQNTQTIQVIGETAANGGVLIPPVRT
jgi:hypothetical protein